MPSAKQLAKVLFEQLSKEEVAHVITALDRIIEGVHTVERSHVVAAEFRQEVSQAG